MTEKRRLGAFICHCGGNISDFVDVAAVRDAAGREDDVVVARDFMFACSDGAQAEMSELIRSEKLDGIIVASCSPKLHLNTFRGMSGRAGLNPYTYNQVNIREQCSWVHRHDTPAATAKATRLVRGGLARSRFSRPLTDLRVETVPAVLVIGAGVAGIRAALALADMGIAVYVVEREATVGGNVATWGKLFPHDRPGSEIVATLLDDLNKHPNISLFTNAELTAKSGSVGNFTVQVQLRSETISLHVGAIIVATGLEPYTPRPGEYGYGTPGVITLHEYKQLVDEATGPLTYQGKRVKTVAYIYCVGSRQGSDPDLEEPNLFCSRYCCSAACHSASLASTADPDLDQIHLYRDMRTYGRHEVLFEEAGRKGSVFMKFAGENPPTVESSDDQLTVKLRDDLAGGEQAEIPADLVVLVAGMVPRERAKLQEILRLPLSKGGFFNEIHVKLRPVETVVDGVFIAGASQGPKTVAEAVASALAAVSKSAALLLKGYIDLPPLVAKVDASKCTLCDNCFGACPYEGAITRQEVDGRQVAAISPNICKGCGGCVPVCPNEAIGVDGVTGTQVTAAIDAMMKDRVHA